MTSSPQDAPIDATIVTKKKDAKPPSALWPTLFIIALLIPTSFYLGPMRLTVYRALLMLLIIPCTIRWISGGAGKIRSYDIYLVLYLLWATIALFVTTAMQEALEPAGMLIIETWGSYMVARCYVRDFRVFHVFSRTLFLSVLILLPFAIIEAVFKWPILFNFFSSLGYMPTVMDMEPRLGMRRAQGPLEHPILFGVFCSCAFSLSFYTAGTRYSTPKGILRSLVVFAGTFFSLSSGAYLGVSVQAMLIVWDRMTQWMKRRWVVLFVLFLAAYVTVDSLSNRTPFEVFVDYLTFSQHNSYNRVLIWHYGTIQVGMTPIFGIGMSQDWFRPWWMHPSMDNYWLVITVSFGLPAFAMFAMLILSMGRRVMSAKLFSEDLNNARKAAWITIVGVGFSISTVHLWNASYVLFIFLLGSSAWLVDIEDPGPALSLEKTDA